MSDTLSLVRRTCGALEVARPEGDCGSRPLPCQVWQAGDAGAQLRACRDAKAFLGLAMGKVSGDQVPIRVIVRNASHLDHAAAMVCVRAAEHEQKRLITRGGATQYA